MWAAIILAVLLFATPGYGIYQKRKTYREIDRLLDSVLSREMIVYPDTEEGEYSALVSKIKQIQEVLGNHARSAEIEKEQVKSLVSNMSHQLKTPLANISLYAEILGKDGAALGRKAEFADKMLKHIDKLNWIVESLSKMVKLEQNIDGFEAKDTGIKQTILDAVDTVYEKLEKKGICLVMEPFEDRLLYHNRKWTAEVFVNLLENAVKYTEKGGGISICVKTYGLFADAFIFLLYNLVLRRSMDYYMAHVLQFLHLTSNVPNMVLAGIMALNAVLAVIAVMLPARKLVRENIISEIAR